MTSTPDRVPHALLHNLKHNKVLHERVVFLTVVMRDIPFVRTEERIEVKSLGCDFYQFLAYYGFKEDPDVPELLEDSGKRGLAFEMMETTLLRLAGDADPDGLAGHGDVARAPVRVDVEERRQGDPSSSGSRPTGWSSSVRRWSCRQGGSSQ